MDCKTARLLVEFDRPAASELDGADGSALREHLAHCPDCNAQAGNDRRLDAHLGRALRQVEVPAHLRGQILGRLQAERRAVRRRWLHRGFRAAAVAAALLLGTWGWAHWHHTPLPVLDPEHSREAVNVSRQRYDEAQAQLQRLGVNVTVPEDLEYRHLVEAGLAELPGYEGTKVACLVFADHDQLARVYIVSARQMDLKELVKQNPGLSGTRYNLDIRYESGDSQACLIFYTGGSLDWLKPRENLG